MLKEPLYFSPSSVHDETDLFHDSSPLVPILRSFVSFALKSTCTSSSHLTLGGCLAVRAELTSCNGSALPFQQVASDESHTCIELCWSPYCFINLRGDAVSHSWVGWPRGGSSNLDRNRACSLFHAVQTGFGVHQASYLWVPGLTTHLQLVPRSRILVYKHLN
jgi:hypothetical protein